MASYLPQLQAALKHVKPPVLIVLGSPRRAAELVAELPAGENACFQMDLYQAGRLREHLDELGLQDTAVETGADVWDLPARFQTVVYPAMARGERELKLDLVEQAQHVLAPGGLMMTLSEYERDDLFGPLHKKIFGKVSSAHVKGGAVFWSQRREADRPRRRHEVTFHAKIGPEGESCTFLSRPGVFAYGRLDDGSRALLEVAELEAGERVLDLGCGSGTNGVLAGRRLGPTGHVSFVDSNLRAVALSGLNAKANGLADFHCVAARQLEGLPAGQFDAVLANPPYYAQAGIARMFVERGRQLLKSDGQFWLVTKQTDLMMEVFQDGFAAVAMAEQRGYSVLAGRRPITGPLPKREYGPPRGRRRWQRDEEE